MQITGGSVGGTNNAALFLDGDANVTTSGSAFIAGANNGILVNGVGNILATGFIEGSLHGIYVGGNNSSLTVGAGGIVGSNAGTGAYFSGSNASVTVASSGTIEGVTGDGVYFASSGTVNNAGTISSDDQDGINLGSGTVFSSGSIIGGPTGINATGPVAITLQGGGNRVSDVYAIHTANANSNITIIGRAQIYYLRRQLLGADGQLRRHRHVPALSRRHDPPRRRRPGRQLMATPRAISSPGRMDISGRTTPSSSARPSRSSRWSIPDCTTSPPASTISPRRWPWPTIRSTPRPPSTRKRR